MDNSPSNEAALVSVNTHKIRNIASLITAITVICGAICGGFGWVVNQIDGRIEEQTEQLQQDISSVKLSTLRNELLILIHDEPDNVLEVERVAKTYFALGGDWYMTGIYSRYAKEHDADMSFITKE